MERVLLHTRTISIETRPLGRGGGSALRSRAAAASLPIDAARLGLHAELRDVRAIDMPAYLGVVHPAGVVHHMALDVELDRDLVVREIDAGMATAPFEPSEKTRGEGCRHILPSYRKLLGLRMDTGYALEVLNLVGGPQGCFHILSLAQCLPMAVRAATRRLCAGALRMPSEARAEVAESCAEWHADAPLWSRVVPDGAGGFRDFRRTMRITAWTDDAVRIGLTGRLRDEAADEDPYEAELMLLLELPGFTIVEADASLAGPPFPGCTAALDGARRLQQLSITRGFTGSALERIGGGAGCAHLSALVVAGTPVTAQAAGAFAGFLKLGPDRKLRQRPSPQVDSCHMWRAGGPLSSL